MEEKIKQEKVKKVFLEDLPKRKGGNINWLKTKGYKVHFIYDYIEGWIEILNIKRENKKTMLGIKYLNNDVFYIFTGHFQKCKLGEMLGLINHQYTYKVGDIIKDEKRNIIITKLTRNKEYKAYEYRCLNDGYLGLITEGHILSDRGCPVCNHNAILRGVNDIATTHPHFIKYFKNIEDTYINSYGSDREVLFKCPYCGFERKNIIGTTLKNGIPCPKCGDGISLPNKIIFNILEQLLGLDNFETEYSPKWCKYMFNNKLRQGFYDSYFELNDKNYIIEMDGGFHENDNLMTGQTKEESKFIDDEKDRLAQENDIEKPIRINCYPSEFEYIKQNILQNKRLSDLFDLSIIDWTIVFQSTLTDRMKEACDLWNDNYTILEICGKLKLSDGTIRRYLNNGNKLNLCVYDGIKRQADSNSRRVKCIEYNLIFNSITECANKMSAMLNLNFNISNIAEVCKGNRKTHHKLHFEFV